MNLQTMSLQLTRLQELSLQVAGLQRGDLQGMSLQVRSLRVINTRNESVVTNVFFWLHFARKQIKTYVSNVGFVVAWSQ